ncbi:hypothetical protein PHABIO_148 [Pseudomonas phage Phabio]|uniref:Uncharacterized protein n=1 Tax=Pseudomonas phage Phabio TaxID=2006668 RepID=A0A1Y0SZ41_9CAUD|nr:hypothetical protein MZD05_gp148 [Pseudomonas phage Phabio]ARV76779.1 hypothetical protein PHABIO_148 [Pseudomonas phage Phabio]
MTNIYVAIDQSWSYNFFGGLKDELDGIDQYVFTDTVYRIVADFIRLSHNVRIVADTVAYNQGIYSIWADLEKQHDIPVPYFQVNFRQLFFNHQSIFNLIDRPILVATPITTDTGDLQGFVFTLG